jgi:type II secretory pathway component HofQ
MFCKALPAIFALVLFPVGCVATAQDAQPEPKKPARVRTLDELADRKITLELKDATLKEALDALFKKVPVNRLVMIDTAVDTKITMKMEDVPFEGALTCILRSTKRMPLRYDAAGEILVVGSDDRQGGLIMTRTTKTWLDVKDVDVRYALKALLKASHADYTVDPSIAGQLTAVVNGEPFDAALKHVCENKATPISFRVEDGLYRFVANK